MTLFLRRSDSFKLAWLGKIDQVLADFVKEPIQTNYKPTPKEYYFKEHPENGPKKTVSSKNYLRSFFFKIQ